VNAELDASSTGGHGQSDTCVKGNRERRPGAGVPAPHARGTHRGAGGPRRERGATTPSCRPGPGRSGTRSVGPGGPRCPPGRGLMGSTSRGRARTDLDFPGKRTRLFPAHLWEEELRAGSGEGQRGNARGARLGPGPRGGRGNCPAPASGSADRPRLGGVMRDIGGRRHRGDPCPPSPRTARPSQDPAFTWRGPETRTAVGSAGCVPPASSAICGTGGWPGKRPRCGAWPPRGRCVTADRQPVPGGGVVTGQVLPLPDGGGVEPRRKAGIGEDDKRPPGGSTSRPRNRCLRGPVTPGSAGASRPARASRANPAGLRRRSGRSRCPKHLIARGW